MSCSRLCAACWHFFTVVPCFKILCMLSDEMFPLENASGLIMSALSIFRTFFLLFFPEVVPSAYVCASDSWSTECVPGLLDFHRSCVPAMRRKINRRSTYTYICQHGHIHSYCNAHSHVQRSYRNISRLPRRMHENSPPSNFPSF